MFPSGELIPSADASGNRTHPQETLLNVNPDSMLSKSINATVNIFIVSFLTYLFQSISTRRESLSRINIFTQYIITIKLLNVLNMYKHSKINTQQD